MILIIAGSLSGCGDDLGKAVSTGQVSQSPTGNTASGSGATPKVLVVGLSGVQYTALQAGIANNQLPNLKSMAVVSALAGGFGGTTTQQPTLSGPGWATVLTGTWANRHGVLSDYADQALEADPLFKLAQQAGANGTAAFASWGTINALLSPAIGSGYVNTSIDCNGVDSCVMSAATNAITAGTDSVVFANLTGPQTVASASGLGGNYPNALVVADNEIGQLFSTIKAREGQSGVNENWLVLVTTDQGLDATGSESGLPLLSNQTSFIAANQTLTVANATTAPGTIQPAPTLAQLTTGATQADITPTVLTWLGAVPNANTYAIDGTSLVGNIGARSLQATPRSDLASFNLTWTPPPTTPSQFQLYRAGNLIATLSGSAQSYVDTQLGESSNGLYTFNYTLVGNNAAVSTLAQINYVQPVVLDPTLASGLIHYFSFNSGLSDVIIPSVAIAQFNPSSTTTASFVADNFNAEALQIASLNTVSNALNGMKLADDVTNKPQFTVGFWFYSGDGQNDSPVITNKDWSSGLNPGFTIAEESNGQLKFNIADGSVRSDGSLNFTKNAWIYVAMTVDTTSTKTATGYIDDPVYGLETTTLSMSSMNMSKIPGVYGTIGFNESATGKYYSSGQGIPGTMTFNDMTMWNKVLTSAQVNSLYASNKSLSTLNP
ncbi:alkaline phosphatase family protein [Paraburkholderia sediminicola]|uniref:alkaline phosphatase family protein n=1 Tax=Paraburkholderia sediminicola TaxID=458836 RepID=UPI0038B7F011